jgi:hypothetical protein
MMRSLKERSVGVEAAGTLSKEEPKDRIVRGVPANRECPEYTELYAEVIRRAPAEAGER